MIINSFFNSNDSVIICITLCFVVVLATVMIRKAMRYRKQVKQNEREKTAPGQEQELEMIMVPPAKPESSYKEKFLCRNEIKKRDCVYISHDIHSKIIRLIKALALDDKKITIGGYIDTVLREHLEEYRDEINNIYSGSRKDLL